MNRLTFPMLNFQVNPSYMRRLLSSTAQGSEDFWKTFKPCHVGIHWKALTEFFQMSTHVPGFQSFFSGFLHHFVIAKLASRSMYRLTAANSEVPIISLQAFATHCYNQITFSNRTNICRFCSTEVLTTRLEIFI